MSTPSTPPLVLCRTIIEICSYLSPFKTPADLYEDAEIQTERTETQTQTQQGFSIVNGPSVDQAPESPASRCSSKPGSPSASRKKRCTHPCPYCNGLYVDSKSGPDKGSSDPLQRTRSSSLGRNKSPGLETVRKSRITKRSSKSTPRIKRCKGLINPHNLCYQNALYQCLFNMPEFVSYLDGLHNPALEHTNHVKGNCVVCKVKTMMDVYAKGNSNKVPDNLRENVHAVMKRAISWSHRMGEDIKRNLQSCPYEFLEYLLEVLLAEAKFDDQISQHEIFGLSIKSEWICEDCGEVHNTFGQTAGNQGTGIVLDIQDPKKGLSMMEYMRQVEFQSRVDVKCDSLECILANSSDKSRTKKRYITEAPEILVIRLKRDAMVDKQGLDKKSPITEIKITGAVPFEEYINLGEFTESGAPLFYQLQGVVSHNGPNLHCGHYIASVRQSDGISFCTINDQDIQQERGGVVRELYQPRSHNSNFEPYVLFYTKI